MKTITNITSDVKNNTIVRVYNQKIVSGLTLNEIETLIKTDDVAYSADYGLVGDDMDVKLIFSMN